MFRCVHAAVALCLSSLAFGQASPTLKLTGPPPENLIKDPSFEQPSIKGRISVADGGNPRRAGEDKTNWMEFQMMGPDKPGEGTFTVGLTDEFAHTGKQSIFVDLNKVTGLRRKSLLLTDIIKIKPGNTYRIGLWGRTDPKRPLTLDQRLLYMKVKIEFLTPDTEDQSGEIENRTMMVPGNSKRVFFVSNKWTEYVTAVRTPRDAGWMQVTFSWETGREQGMTDGTIYFDDASVSLVPEGETLIPIDESDTHKPTPEPDESPAPAPAPAPPPAKSPTKKK
jgi:ribosomal protein L24E